MSKIIILARLYWPHGGGVERHVEGLCKVLVKQGHKITIVTEQFKPGLKLREKYRDVSILRIPYRATRSKGGVWKWMRQHRSLFEKADIIHIHDVFWWYFPTRIRLWRKAVHTTFHGYEGVRPPRWQAVVERKAAEKLSKGTLCVGEFMRKWYHAKPTAITYGASLCRACPLPRTHSATYLGRLDADAGIMTYLEALPLLKQKITVDVYGSGGQEQQALALIKTRSLPVALHGWSVYGSRVLRHSRYAFVSRYLAILEAMQTKRLVVAVYNNAIKKDYLTTHPMRENMLIAGTPQELADQLNGLTIEREKDMIAAAHTWASSQTWEALTKQYLKLWAK